MEEKQINPREFADKTVERAIKAACAFFKCQAEELEINVITKGSTGLFGLGGRKAKITATLKPAASQEKRGSGSVDQLAMEDAEATPDAKEAYEEKESTTREFNTSEARKAIGPARGNRPKITPEEINRRVERARNMVTEILEKASLKGDVDIVEGEHGPYLNISGEDLSIIIGKEGQCLDSIEYLVNLFLIRQDEARYRIKIEAEGYREKKDRGLVMLAERMAQKARKTGKPVTLRPMDARERRIIHITLKAYRGIRTHSAGEGYKRKVVITPLYNKGRPKKGASR